MGLQLSRWSNRRFGVLLLEQLYGNANVAKPALILGHALIAQLATVALAMPILAADFTNCQRSRTIR
jgi:hypothetical protein